MVKSIGCDIVEHSLTKKLKWEDDISLLQTYFSSNELELYRSKKSIEFLSGRYAAKEAVLKCLGTGMNDGISLAGIETLQNEDEKPEIKLTGEVKKISDELGISTWHISITHSQDYSLAFVIAE